MTGLNYEMSKDGLITFSIDKPTNEPGDYLKEIAEGLHVSINLDPAKGFHDLFFLDEGEEPKSIEGKFSDSEYTLIESEENVEEIDSGIDSFIVESAIKDPLF